MSVGFIVIIWTAIALFLMIFIGYFIGIYNSFIRLKNNADKSWANIDVLLKQRSDELPNLIAAVKGYMKHERSLLEGITNARTALISANTMYEKAKADDFISASLKTLFAVAENYPTLKANENFLKLQQRITGLENEIADRREFFNDSVTTYNTKLESFPDMVIGRLMKLQKRELFKTAESEGRT